MISFLREKKKLMGFDWSFPDMTWLRVNLDFLLDHSGSILFLIFF